MSVARIRLGLFHAVFEGRWFWWRTGLRELRWRLAAVVELVLVETETGTTQRDVVWLGVVHIQVSFSVSAKWLQLLTGFKQQEKISVDYFDTETLAVKNAEMFIDGYKAGVVKDTSYRG